MLTRENNDACCRHPPQITVMPVQNELSGKVFPQIVSVYPPVNPELAACGDFSMRLQKHGEPADN